MQPLDKDTVVGPYTSTVTRSCDVYTIKSDKSSAAFIGPVRKTNSARYLAESGIVLVKLCGTQEFENEQASYQLVSTCPLVCPHYFFIDGGVKHVIRSYCTSYSLLDLCSAFRSSDFDLVLRIAKCVDIDTSDWPENWYDPIEQESRKYWRQFGPIIYNCLQSANDFGTYLIEHGIIATLTADNLNLNGKWLDFGDYTISNGVGCVVMDSFYSYLMPLLNNCDYITELEKFEINPLEYDFSILKYGLFKKYFPHWPYDYHPDCIKCSSDRCLLHCINFNILLSQPFEVQNGPLVEKQFHNGIPMYSTCGYVSSEMGVVFNAGTKMSSPTLESFLTLCDASLHITTSTALRDDRPGVIPIGIVSHRSLTVKPAEVNLDFYNQLKSWGILSPGSGVELKHFFFMQDVGAAIADFGLYRYNKTTMVDICQFLFCFEITAQYFKCYEGGCIKAKDVVVRSPNKSAGFYLNRIGPAGVFYDVFTHEDQDELYEYTKSNILPTVTQINLKRAIASKERSRTVAGVGLFATMTTRQCHQYLLKNIAAARGEPIVIGTTKFYGGWNSMLHTLIDGIDNPIMYGWDYPKCDRSYPTIIRLMSSLIFLRFHDLCCTHADKFYRLCNEMAQVVTETSFCSGALYHKVGGQSSGDALTAYSNSAFNIQQVVSATVGQLLSIATRTLPEEYRGLQRRVYEACYTTPILVPSDVITEFYDYMRDYVHLMILSDDGVAVVNSKLADIGVVPSLLSFKKLLYYQNNVVLGMDKCWVETDMSVGPHEFCSQHSKIIALDGKNVYLPMPDPSRIASALCYVDTTEKASHYLVMERFVAMAIEAWPLIHHENEVVRKLFYCILDYIKILYSKLNKDVFDSFGADVEYDNGEFTDETFYRNMYLDSPIMQFSGTCVVCGANSVLACADCIRRPHLCASCCYGHVTRTHHKTIVGVSVYACRAPGCIFTDVTGLYIASGNFYCLQHLPVSYKVPVCSEGKVFSLYMNSSTPSSLINRFNTISTCDWTSVEDYAVYDVPLTLKLFACETLRACEEQVKSTFGYAVVVAVVNGALQLQWSDSNIPPINVNSVFCGYKLVRSSDQIKYVMLGDFVFERTTTNLYTYTSSYLGRIDKGCKFVLRTHSIRRLYATPCKRSFESTMCGQVYNVNAVFDKYLPVYKLLLSQTVSSVQGPPGTGKSFLAIGLAVSCVGKRVLFTTASHAGVDALCEKALKYLPQNQCTRIVSASVKREIFSHFLYNERGAQYVFSTINSLPTCVVDIVICDEVGMCTDSDLSTLNERVTYSNIVYVGDPEQLSAPRVLCTTTLPPLYYNTVINNMLNNGPTVFLSKCYRCPSPIVDFVSKFCYNGKLTAFKDKGECYSVVLNTQVSYHGVSAQNNGHIDYVKDFLKSYPNFLNAIFLSPYHGQNVRAKNVLGLTTWTVDAAQGAEADYIIFSQTSSSEHAANKNRLNVALTRARKGILCIMCTDVGLAFSEPVLTRTQSNFLRDLAGVVDLNGLQPRMLHDVYAIDPRNCVGYDVEAVHSKGEQLGTSFPMVLGFAGFRNDLELAVYVNSFSYVDEGVAFKSVAWRLPKGFEFLTTYLDQRIPWFKARRKIVDYCCNHHINKNQPLCFIVWHGRLEYSTLPYFCRYGSDRLCFCGSKAYYYSSYYDTYHCTSHATATADHLYNVIFYDACTRVKLSVAHDSVCTVNHGDAHRPSVDARMSLCVFYDKNYVKSPVQWSEPGVIVSDDGLNKAMRAVQRTIVNAVVAAGCTIHDIGNPKGIPATSMHKYVYYDRMPLSPLVTTYEYNPSTWFNSGYTMFWNCNVDNYPDTAIVCRFDTECPQVHSIKLGDGGVLYCNKSVFYTSPYFKPKNLVEWSYSYVDVSPCSSDMTVETGLYINTTRCKTSCNDKIRMCKKHYDSFVYSYQSYHMCVRAGFKFFVPKLGVVQSFSEMANHFVAYNRYMPKSIPRTVLSYVNNNMVYVREDGLERLLYTNSTTLPTSVAFELYVKRVTRAIPLLTVLKGLGVNASVSCTIVHDNNFYTTVTSDVHDFTDVKLYDLYCWFVLDNYNQKYKNSVVFSQAKLHDNSVVFVVGTSCLIDGLVSVLHDKRYITKYVDGKAVELPHTYFSLLRDINSTDDYLTVLEKEFVNGDPKGFIERHNLQQFNIEHIFYGEDIQPTVGGLHLFVGLLLAKRLGWQVQPVLFNGVRPVSVYNVAATNGSNKYITTVINLTLDDMLTILRSLDLSVESAVLSFTIDYQQVRFMLWARDGGVATFYPTLQAKSGYTLPKFMITEDGVKQTISIPNYGLGMPLPCNQTYAKYFQVLQYLRSTTMCVPHKMRALHLGAASHLGTAPGTAVLRNTFPYDVVIIDCDLRKFVSDANQLFVIDFVDLVIDKVDFVFSDVYGDALCMSNLASFCRKNLSFGGTVAIKLTESSYSDDILTFIQDFGYWTLFVTGTNVTSSECFAIGVNYLGYCPGRRYKASDVFASYCTYRNIIELKPTSASLYDVSTYNTPWTATPIVNIDVCDPSKFTSNIRNLLTQGKLIIR